MDYDALLSGLENRADVMARSGKYHLWGGETNRRAARKVADGYNLHEDRWDRIFRELDPEHHGYVSQTDFKVGIERMGIHLDDREKSSILSLVDPENHQEIQYALVAGQINKHMLGIAAKYQEDKLVRHKAHPRGWLHVSQLDLTHSKVDDPGRKPQLMNRKEQLGVMVGLSQSLSVGAKAIHGRRVLKSCRSSDDLSVMGNNSQVINKTLKHLSENDPKIIEAGLSQSMFVPGNRRGRGTHAYRNHSQWEIAHDPKSTYRQPLVPASRSAVLPRRVRAHSAPPVRSQGDGGQPYSPKFLSIASLELQNYAAQQMTMNNGERRALRRQSPRAQESTIHFALQPTPIRKNKSFAKDFAKLPEPSGPWSPLSSYIQGDFSPVNKKLDMQLQPAGFNDPVPTRTSPKPQMPTP